MYKSKIDFKTQKFAVIGLGDTGLSIVEYLKFKQAKIVRIFDTRDNPPHQDDIRGLNLICGKLDINQFNGIDVIVISPGISIYDESLQWAIRSGIQVVGDIELFALAIKDWSDTKVIGITGSNGKTTVTTLTGHLAGSVGIPILVAGNIGMPVLSAYIDIVKKSQIPKLVVLELSSFQLETTYSLDLISATVLNISEDHLDRYRDLLEYAYNKANIFNNAQIQILNLDDPLVLTMSRPNLNHEFFAIKNKCNNSIIKKDNDHVLVINNQEYLQCSKLNLVGVHNYLNTLASLLLLKAAGIDIERANLKQALLDFKAVEHRMEKVAVFEEVVYIDDSKGTNVGAVIAGVGGLDKPVHLILGGDGKGQDFTPLRQLVLDKCHSVAIIGVDGDKIAQVLLDISIPIKRCKTLEDAVDFCKQNAKKNEYVVLSPACASWDMFDNYKHRAKVFKEHINAYIK